MEFRDARPYPAIGIEQMSRHSLGVLQQLYSGMYSEMTAMTQYQYQSCVQGAADRELTYVFAQLSAVERHHMRILGQLITLLGGTPKYCGSDGHPWNGQFVDYLRDPCKMLLKNLENEVESADAYLSAAGQVDDRKISVMLRRIADDEVVHAQILRELIARRGCNKK